MKSLLTKPLLFLALLIGSCMASGPVVDAVPDYHNCGTSSAYLGMQRLSVKTAKSDRDVLSGNVRNFSCDIRHSGVLPAQ